MANLVPLLLNNVYSTVQAGSSAIGSSSATGVNVATGDGANFGTIGTNEYIPAVIVDTSTSPETVKEYVYVTARSTDALTVVRQAEETTRYGASPTTIQAGYVIASVQSRASSGVGALNAGERPNQWGLLSWNFDPVIMQASTTAAPASGRVVFCRIPVPYTMTINNLIIVVSTAGSTLTANQCFAAIYSSAGSRLAVSADISTSLTSTGLKTLAMTSPPVVIGGPSVWVYGAILANGTTPPQYNAINIVSNAVGSQGLGLGASGSYRVDFQSGQTSMPSTATLGGGTSTALWMALS